MSLDKNVIAEKLNERRATLPCSRCGSKEFSILDGFSKFSIQEDTKRMGDTVLGGAAVPFVIIACSNCGAMTPHALGALGLLSGEKNEG